MLVLTLSSLLSLFEVALAFGPSFIAQPPAMVLYSNNTGLVLDCLARGEPPPLIDWVDENGNVLSLSPNFARYTTTSSLSSSIDGLIFICRRLHNGSLYLLPFSQDPLGHFRTRSSSSSRSHHSSSSSAESRFRCRASNPYGKIVSRVILVKPGKLSQMAWYGG